MNEAIKAIQSSKSNYLTSQKDKPTSEWFKFDKEQVALIEKAIKDFNSLQKLLETLAQSRCHNLLDFLIFSVIEAHNTLKQILLDELEEKLNSIGYPFVGNEAGTDLKNGVNRNMAEEQIKQCVFWLLRIDLESILARNSVYVNDKLGAATDSSYSLLIRVFSRPFEKRFKFHFFGSRKTNNLEKVFNF